MTQDKKDMVEYSSAVICVASAITIGYASMFLTQNNSIDVNVLVFIAQLLLFAASVFHINYKLGKYGESK